jgi:hypothetical protein
MRDPTKETAEPQNEKKKEIEAISTVPNGMMSPSKSSNQKVPVISGKVSTPSSVFLKSESASEK